MTTRIDEASGMPQLELSPGTLARARLVEMRASLIAQLDRVIDGGGIALLGSVQLTIDAIDEATQAEESI